ncbi:DNA cytosine methyltransferase [Helicobacter mesocricetorum]|uniref:DNA cytosine methyltransferase n=1 Tax=Helicobacter mesocricetorum TaxID=87012 RepID=UPI0018F84FA1|nr:DNA cytosine methyltransferase [Helicobacter mesocricetorum]
MFSGIGGFALGLQKADKDFYQTISFCEINAYYAEVLEKNFSGIPIEILKHLIPKVWR